MTNPPWEVFKPHAKEFFAEHSELVTKKNMTIKEFEKEQARLLKNKGSAMRGSTYQGRFPHVSAVLPIFAGVQEPDRASSTARRPAPTSTSTSSSSSAASACCATAATAAS